MPAEPARTKYCLVLEDWNQVLIWEMASFWSWVRSESLGGATRFLGMLMEGSVENFHFSVWDIIQWFLSFKSKKKESFP